MHMVRIFTEDGDDENPRIERSSVKKFFEERAEKSDALGYVQAVIYQDNNPQLAFARDAAEKEKLLPLLNLTSKHSVLDVGCGTGRWADVIVPVCQQYVGTDFSQELIDIAAKRFITHKNANFLCMPAEELGVDSLGQTFDRIISMGLFIYLNDDELQKTLAAYNSLANLGCRILLREPVGTQGRLTIKEHFSEDMNQHYNAIYRTQNELLSFIQAEMLNHGTRLIDSGDLYPPALNNRADTKQMWFLLEK